MTGVNLRWAVSGLGGLAVLVLCLVEVSRVDFVDANYAALAILALLDAAAVTLCRERPAAALALAWTAALVHVPGNVPVLLSDVTMPIVLFATARWGSRATATLGGLSVAIAPVLGLIWLRGSGLYYRSPGGLIISDLINFTGSDIHQTSLAIVGLALLGLPWFGGLVLRLLARADAAQQATSAAQAAAEVAQEIARLQEEQTRLARDVHDVVGHSLAVILAQAESAQYVADDDPEAMQKTMRNIADSARASLQDVRAVLTSTSAAAPLGGLDSLVDGVRQGGYEVAATAAGRVQPLPPELAAVAYRVLQEMLTNAIKHGRRDRPVEVLQAWPEPSHPAFYLRLKVVNTVGPPSDLPPGSGLDGMRRRLESVGGHLQAGRSDDTFTATAWIPVRPASGEGFPL